MGAADIVREALESSAVRSQIGQAGKRIFKANLQSPIKDGDGNILSWLWLTAVRLTSQIGPFLKSAGINVSGIWSLFVSTSQFIWNFNWNMTDDEIDQQIANSWNAIGSMLGGTLGNAFGQLVCGVLPSAYIFTFNEALGAHLLADVSEELAEEFIANLSNLIRYTFMSGVQQLLLLSFKNIRKFIKGNSVLIGYLFGDNAQKAVQAWGSANSKPWSFAKAMDDAVEAIPNEFLRNFVEEFLEEAWEGCVEAGYIVANGIDSYLAQQKLAQARTPVLGRQRYVEITPDRSNDRERIVLAGPQESLKPMIVQTLSNYQLIENRDVGSLVGMPADEYMRAKPQTVRIIITFYSVQKPPFISGNGVRLVRATYSVSDLKRSKCTWEDIKLACGGTNGYMWGRYRCTAKLNNGRKLVCMGATPDEAEDRVRALAVLSSAEIVGNPTPSEDRKKDIAGAYIKQPTRLYPAFFTIMNQYKVSGAFGSGIPLSDGIYNRKNDKIYLWTDTEPLGTSERIAELLTRPGAEDP
ncbi:hypothetical protein [Tolypothrix sp. PCC 7601]|uniref:hypothetical protein n=1 Tax=Tolypothrix sp. PCC 7601 TaxID=1188 RepID=UPI0021E0870D|nr:hypothetical protein [Tolypothrix sp. PCC 7601]UYD38977.1 hypothetical protein HG267_41400 [Tolypothrix sp. PCC 7601]